MKFKRIVALALALGMTVSSAFTGVPATVHASDVTTKVESTELSETEGKQDSSNEIESKSGKTVLTEIDKSEVGVSLIDQNKNQEEKLDIVPEDDEMVRVIIVMDGDSIIEKDADAELGFFTKLKTSYMESKQRRLIKKIENQVFGGEDLDVKYHYTWLLNGISAEVPYGMIDEIEALSGIENVILQPVYEVEKEENIETYTVADGVMIGREDTWASGYTGKGMKIAIIDTGLDDDHQNFQEMPEEALTEDSATKDSVASVLEELNASKTYKGLTVDQVYRSNKVAFGFNYVDGNLTINHSKDSQGDHGTHVAGIAAANDLGNGEAVGVAPDAQLYIMKIFGSNGGAYTEDILAALEDALKLDADVINMSLGTPAGFTSESEEVDAIYSRVSETDTILAVAAGNSSTSGLSNMWGTNTNLTSNPDNSMISSPASYKNVTSVASIENVGIRGYYVSVNGNKLAYTEGSDGTNLEITTISGKDLEYVMVDQCGQTAEDFEKAGVNGKVAVVSRGITPFVDKIQLAQDAGAVACLIYNNTTGSFGMDLSTGTSTIPAAAISMNAGEQLKAYAQETQQPTLQFSNVQDVIPNEDAYIMSDFSSWGIAPDLKLEPDVTGPGGNIYSTLDDGKYGIESGTSMASPNVAGISALIMQYAKATHPKMSDSELHTFVNALLLSTAIPVEYDSDTDYSPRSQGAGLANAYSATKTKAYLSIDSNDMPKAELFDDPAKTGNYGFTYHVNNFGDQTIYYDLNTTVQTEEAHYDEETEKEFMALAPYALQGITSEVSDHLIYTYDYDENNQTDSHDAREVYIQVKNQTVAETGETFRYEVDADEDTDFDDVQAYLDALVGKDSEAKLDDQILKVEAGETVDVAVTISLTKDDKAYLDTHYENGIYVEGFTKLTARSEGDVDLSMPYLGFYGDWTQAPTIDNGYYWETQEETEASQYVNMLWTTIEGSDWMPGTNPYDASEPFNVENITVSPNDDGITDTIDDIYITLLRNAKKLSVRYDNAETGENYFSNAFEYVRKTYYVTAYASMFPFLYTNYAQDLYNFKDADGKALENNTKLTLTVEATVDYDKHESANVFDKWVLPVTVDTEKPVIESVEVVKDTENNKQYLEVVYHDNQRTAGICFLNKRGTTILSRYAVGEGVTPGETCTKRFDITGYGNEFILVLGDYAVNETYYTVETTENVPEVKKDQLYGYRMHDEVTYNSSVYGWVSIDPNTAEMTVLDSEADQTAYITAAEYVDGYIFAVDYEMNLSYIIPGLWDERHEISQLGVRISTMTYDSVDKVLYGYSDSEYSITKIDMLTGKAEVLEPYSMFDTPRALTCDEDGNLYGINMDGKLRKINKTAGEWEEEVLINTVDYIAEEDSYVIVAGAQSMTYDKETNSIYWAGYTNSIDSRLYRYNLTSGQFDNLGKIGDNAEITGLMKLSDKNFTIPKEEQATGITLDSQSVSILEGSTLEMTVKPTPWYGVLPSLTWESKDETVVTVDQSGVITAVKEGTTKVSVSDETGGVKAECEVTVVNPKAELNAYILASNNGHRNIWMKAAANDLSGMETVSAAGMNTLYAAEYVDGTIYAYNDTTEFYHIDASTHKEQKVGEANSTWSLRDMAYDYSTGFMYGIAKSSVTWSVCLVKIDMMTGQIEQCSESLMDSAWGVPVALAVSTTGEIYMVTGTGIFCQYHVEEGYLEEIAPTGVVPTEEQLQAMTYDHVNGGIYWSYNDGTAVEKIAYMDPKSGSALNIGSVAGGAQLVGLYTVPTQIPERPAVPVESIYNTKDKVVMVEGMKTVAPVSVRPFNATDRNMTWEMDKEGVVTIQNNIITAIAEGSTKVTASIGNITAEFEVQVVKSAGDIRGYICSDLSEGSGKFWAEFKDSDLSTGVGLAMGDTYSLEAGEYYNGKIYGYAVPTDGSSYDQQFIVIDVENDEYNIDSFVSGDFPYVQDMAFDYSEGVMYAVAGIKNMSDSSQLYAINLETGYGYKIGEGYDFELKTLACTTDGQLYSVASNGDFYAVDKESGDVELLFNTGYKANKFQSMAYDHNTGNLYWAQCYSDLDMSTAVLVLISPEEKSAESLGQIGMSGCQVTGMYIEPKDGLVAGTPKLQALKMNVNDEILAVGSSTKLSVGTVPMSVNLADTKITFSSDNEEVATVDAQGNVTAVSKGIANITATANGKTAVCKIHVLGDDTKLLAMNSNGWQSSPMLTPMQIDDTIKLPQDAGLKINRVTKSTDGLYYAFGEDGYLWKFTEDLTQIERIGEKGVLELLSNLDSINQWGGIWSSEIIDITANSFTGDVYALIEVNMMNYIYKLDLTTGEAQYVRYVPETVGRPKTIVFTEKDTMMVYAGYNDYIYKMSLTDGEPVKGVVWAQSTVVAEEDIGMVYCKELNRVFIATAAAYSESGELSMGLYILNPDTGVLKKYGNAAYNEAITGLIVQLPQ